MSTILYRTDPFEQSLPEVVSLFKKKDSRGVRRPLYGYVPKADRFASLSLRQSGAEGNLVPVSMPDQAGPAVEGKGWSNHNHNFLLTQVSHVESEKMQIVETFGEDFVFFFGERPLVLQVQGLLMNTADFSWKQEWLSNYRNYLRGTRCVQNRTRVYLSVDDQLYSGYVFGTSVADDSKLPHVCQFSFKMLVFSHVDVGNAVVRSVENTRLVGDSLYVDYIEAPLEVEKLYFIDPITGQSSPFDPQRLTGTPFALTASDAMQRVQAWFEELGEERLMRESLLYRRQAFYGGSARVPGGALLRSDQ